MPHLDPIADTPGDRCTGSAAGHVHMEERNALLIPKQGADPGNFMDIFQLQLHGLQGQASVSSRPDHQSAAIIRAANDYKGSGFNVLIKGELLYYLVDDLAIFQPKHKNSAGLSL